MVSAQRTQGNCTLSGWKDQERILRESLGLKDHYLKK